MRVHTTTEPAPERRISPLRRRMIDDVTIRNLSPTTQRLARHLLSLMRVRS